MRVVVSVKPTPGGGQASQAALRYEPERRSDHIGFRVVAVRP